MREARAETGLERNFRGILSRVCIFGIGLPKGPSTLDRSFRSSVNLTRWTRARKENIYSRDILCLRFKLGARIIDDDY